MIHLSNKFLSLGNHTITVAVINEYDLATCVDLDLQIIMSSNDTKYYTSTNVTLFWNLFDKYSWSVNWYQQHAEPRHQAVWAILTLSDT